MKRLDKTITLTFNSILQEFKEEYIWLVISEGWCGDAAQLYHIIKWQPKRIN
jgi:hypothetical protein